MKKAKEYLLDYIEYKKKDKSVNTVEGYFSDLKQFFTFHKSDLENVDDDVVKNYTAYMLSKNLKAKTINRKLVSLRQYIEYINTKTDIRIYAEIKLLKIQKQDYLEEVLTKIDFDRLVRLAQRENDSKAIAIFYTLYLTGARVSELLQFKVIDAANEMVTVKGKGSKYRDLFIPDILKEYLSTYIKARQLGEDDYLFVNNQNNRVMTRQSVHNLIKEYAGLSKVKLSRAHAHNFRHLYAFRLIELGLSTEEVADLLGHSDINTTKIYTRKTKGELVKAIKALK